MKLFNKFFAPLVLSASLLVGLCACSGSSDSDTSENNYTMTVDEFSSGQYSIPVHGPSVFTLAPTGLYSSGVGANGSVTVEGNILVGGSTVPAIFVYSTLGSGSEPTIGNLEVTLRYVEDATNTELLNGTGVPSNTKFKSLNLTFYFQTGYCDLLSTGFQTQTSTSGSDDVTVSSPFPGIIYRLAPGNSF